MTLKEFNDCTEEIAEVLDKYLKIEVNDLTEINEMVEFYIDKHNKRDGIYFRWNDYQEVNGGSK
tara:strand:- start:3176 stop:3367 length:192 start_codon:yes stop_codon:yes gene_type:complete